VHLGFREIAASVAAFGCCLAVALVETKPSCADEHERGRITFRHS
jgi:hypothetical protein